MASHMSVRPLFFFFVFFCLSMVLPLDQSRSFSFFSFFLVFSMVLLCYRPSPVLQPLYRLQTIAIYSLQIIDQRLYIDYRLQTIHYRLQTIQTRSYRLQTIDYRLWVIDYRLQTADYRLQIMDYRLYIVYRLQTINYIYRLWIIDYIQFIDYRL